MTNYIFQNVLTDEIITDPSELLAYQKNEYSYITPVYDYHKIQADFLKLIQGRIKGLSDFLPWLPLEKAVVTLGEGSTPCVHFKKWGARVGLENFYVKNEAVNPTGSFKDRESWLLVNAALEQRYPEVALVSSGNAALSAAAYANVAGIVCSCHVPLETSAGKKGLLKMLNAKITEYDAEYEEIHHTLGKILLGNKNVWNIAGGYNDIRDEANKTIAYELYQQLGELDVVVVPVGNGALLYGIYKGFVELQLMGLIKKLPVFYGVEVVGFAPVAEAMKQGVDKVVIKEVPTSVAEAGIAAQEAFCSPKAIAALKKTGGNIIEITDNELIEATKQIIADESFVFELTSMAPFAALPKIDNLKNKKVVAVATGSGYKNIDEIITLTNKKSV